MGEARGEGLEDDQRREADFATVRAILAAFSRLDIDDALQYLSPSIRFMPHGTAHMVGREQPYLGHAGVRQYIADAARAWDEIQFIPKDFQAVDDDVVVFGRVIATVGGERFERPLVWIWQLRDGLATSMRVSSLDG